ncbi:MAG: hypothetical protein ABTQ34_00080 [Bdellovibrionales bacterium]
MRKELVNDLLQGLLMAAVVAAAIPMPELAWATLSDSVGTVQEGIRDIPNIVSGVFYIGGAAMIGAGAMKLRAHAENPSSAPLGHGLGRVGAGACLVSLPAFATWARDSLNVGQADIQSTGLGQIGN